MYFLCSHNLNYLLKLNNMVVLLCALTYHFMPLGGAQTQMLGLIRLTAL